MWLNAWGKLPSCSPLAVSISSASSPRSFAQPTSRSKTSSARSSSPAFARHETSQNEQITKVPSSPPQAVGVHSLLAAVAEDEPALGEVAGDRPDRRAHPPVGR